MTFCENIMGNDRDLVLIRSPSAEIEKLKNFNDGKIASKIELLWGSRELAIYFRELLISNRLGRQGFPQEVFDSILKLFLYHEEEFLVVDREDIWRDYLSRP